MIDVANEARVSQTTVSLVLNHADGARLSPETRERVAQGRSAARLSARCGAVGAPAAASAASIGFVCDEISTDPWTAIGLDGVREKAWEHGLTVTVMVDARRRRHGSCGARAARRPAAARPRLRDHQHPPHRSARRALPACRRFCSTVTRPTDALTSVVPGEVAGGHAATDVLIRAGHRRIGYINGEASMEASRHRLRGYRQALATADLPFDPDLLREGNWQPLSGYEATLALMALPSPPTAIFCANDLMAVGCYEALRELGLNIPADVAVMGYDDREIAQHLHPPLSTRASAAFRDGLDRRRDPHRRGGGHRQPTAPDQGRMPDRAAEVRVNSPAFGAGGLLQIARRLCYESER